MKSGEDEEAVTVNTRALIDKVLARYSGEHTTLRELIQNAADASATTVKIKFETIPSAQVALANTTNQSDVLKHVLLHHTLKQLLVTNDGLAFGTNDWSRLKRIAEGNPDETKIGAFGVGFYSVFADCEEPFVSSGNEAMAFYWKGNSLFTRKMQLPENSTETSFVLDYRNNTSPIPALLPLAQFLATSLTFVALQNIELWIDDWKILSLQKKTAPSVEHAIPRDVETRTKEGLMQLAKLEREHVQMDATFMKIIGWKPSSTKVPKTSSFAENQYGQGLEANSLRSFFSRLTVTQSKADLKGKTLKEEKSMQEISLEDLTATSTSNVFLSVTTGTIRTHVTSSFASELERATKKPPPKTTKLAILTASYDEASASTPKREKGAPKPVDVFASVLPGKTPGGRVFIGFPTHQTTGAGLHLSAPSVIPTVERESIDLNARWVRTWNIEMLRVAGIITRLAFSREMADLGAKVKRVAEAAGRAGKIVRGDIATLLPEARHLLHTFAFAESTPSSQVSQYIEEAFWTAFKKAHIEVYSTQGVLPTTQVRVATEDFRDFVEGIPVIPATLMDIPFVQKLVDFGLVTEITVGDVKKELAAKALNKDQLIAFLNWAGKKAINGQVDAVTIHDLLDNAIAMVGDDESGEIVALATIKHYRNPNKIPPELPAPADTLSWEITRHLNNKELEALGWQQLEIIPWLRFLIESIGGRNGLSTEQDITWSPKFSSAVLATISKQWDAFSQSSKQTIINILTPLTVIPTKFGMKKPGEAYFATVKLFDDLPTVTGLQGVKEKILAALGVRKTVELDTILQRLLRAPEANGDEKATAKWSHVDLIKYLASVRDDIPTEDLKKLRNTPICPAEAGPAGQEATVGTTKRYKISELFEPKQSLRALGLPNLQWPGKDYRPGSPEGRFLNFMGLRTHPTPPELVPLMASGNANLCGKALTYFISNYEHNGYSSFKLTEVTTPFLPVQGNEQLLVRPSECYTNEKSSLLGFHVLQRNFQPHASKFGVAENPPITECINRLMASPPQTHRDAVAIFSYFSTRNAEMGQKHTIRLGDALIIPIARKAQLSNGVLEKTPSAPQVKHVAPRMCFIGDSATYKDIFDFVDFGQQANLFLLHCGSKHEPSKVQVASMLAMEPARVLGIVETTEKYLSLLRTLAESVADLKKDKNLWKQMKISPFLLATREIPAKVHKTSEKIPDDFDEDEDTSIKQSMLAPAHKVTVVDDYTSYRLFKEALLCAPLEETLEDFYIALGSSTISSLVQDSVSLGHVVNKQNTAEVLRKRIVERSRIFLHEYSSDHIKHDSRWLEKNLVIEMVTHINLRRSLRGYTVSHTSKQTATLNHDQKRGWILYITASYDMFHVSQAVITQLLARPNNQGITLFEFLLKSELQDLKRRGYNVDRILRARAADARIAEEERRRQLEAEQKQLREQEELWRQQQQVVAPVAREERHQNGDVAMPGAFGSDSPENSPLVQKTKKTKAGGLFSNLTRRLGIDGQDAQQQLQNFFTGSQPQATANGHGQGSSSGEHPPPYDGGAQAPHHTGTITKRPTDVEKVTSPHALQQNLLNAIHASRPHNSSALFSRPQTTTIKEQSSYCDERPAHNITHIGETANGLRIFVSKNVSLSPTDFLRDNATSLNTFAGLLSEVGAVYNLAKGVLHVFYDEVGSTIAFNSQGSIFCNYRFWKQLHSRAMEEKPVEGRVQATSWWWIVIAHELAHNLVAEHSAEHSYYT
jgi:hypothetical protein